MLDTLPNPVKTSPIPPRRRGGQPANHNALKSGLYARKNPPSFTPLKQAILVTQARLYTDPAVFEQVVLELRLEIARLFQATRDAADLHSKLAWHRALDHAMVLLLRIKKARQRFIDSQLHLAFVAMRALDFIRYDFRSSGITRDAYSFRGKNSKSDLKSPPPREGFRPYLPDSEHAFLTRRQWQVLEPLLPPSDHGFPSSNPDASLDGEELGQGLGTGRPPADPHALLDAIFWKFARPARWQDLPAGSPPMLTCRRYYRRLFRSGRLLTIYTTLYQDLITRGQTDLTALVDQDSFIISGTALALQPGLEETWQLRTALLFMQLGNKVARRILREKNPRTRQNLPRMR